VNATAADTEDARVACRVYTHARRHPVVVGNIQGLRIPPMTPAQLGVLVGSLVVLTLTRAWWAHLGTLGNSFVVMGVPLTLAWLVRSVRMEGRAPWRAGLGWLTLFAASRCGERLGRPERTYRPGRYRARSWVADFEGHEA
jgi:hypothetical protein